MFMYFIILSVFLSYLLLVYYCYYYYYCYYLFLVISYFFCRTVLRRPVVARPSLRERGSAPEGGRTMFVLLFIFIFSYFLSFLFRFISFPPSAAVQWQPDGLTMHTRKTWMKG